MRMRESDEKRFAFEYEFSLELNSYSNACFFQRWVVSYSISTQTQMPLLSDKR